jgi:glycine betaine catabolism B
MNPLHKIDGVLNNFTMYRVIFYGLIVMSLFAVVMGLFGLLQYDGLDLLLSSFILTATCYVTNHLFAKIFKAVVNIESSFITALLLFFLMPPLKTVEGALLLVIAGTIAMASKYVLALHKKHIFNPVAVAAVALSFHPNTLAIWWIGTPIMLPVTAIVGFLVVRKIRRFTLFFAFLTTSYFAIMLFAYVNHVRGVDLFIQQFTSWPLIFFGTFMLTEPLTTPSTRKLQIVYGALVGVLFGMPLNLGILYSSPEVALIIGNIFSYLSGPKKNLLLSLSTKSKIAPDIYHFRFAADQKLPFVPGQYLEWTLSHKHPDTRGNRRYFTIASSPTENDFMIGVKISPDSSSFKKALLNMNEGEKLFASHLAGDFTLRPNANEKLVFIAGGIGITPFRSIIKHLLDTNQKRDIILLFACAKKEEFVYEDIFTAAEKAFGMKTVYVITRPENAPENWAGETGRITDEMIIKVVPDYKKRVYYISGPNAMVEGYKSLLTTLAIPKKQLVTDYFPGF